MKFLHTADWHVGRLLRGRSRAEEHEGVLAELAAMADAHAVDAVLVVGDLFDTAAPTPEAERLVYRALLDLADTGATVVVLAGNHDSDRRLQAVEPVLARGRIVTRPVFAPPRDGGIVEVASRSGRETALVACLPFLSQRYVVRADDLMSDDASDHTQQYAQRMRRLIEVLAAEFRDDTVNVLAAHCMVDGATVAGSERTAHTIFEYAVPATAFPSTAHYVALGHLHRQQLVNGPCPIRYSGSLLQLDFGEIDDVKGALLVEASAGGGPAQVTPLPFSGGRRLRRVSGTMADLRAIAETIDDAYVKVTIEEPWRAGLADETRNLFPDAVEIVVARPASETDRAPRATRTGRPARELFAEYLAERDVDEPRLLALFDELQEAAT